MHGQGEVGSAFEARKQDTRQLTRLTVHKHLKPRLQVMKIIIPYNDCNILFVYSAPQNKCYKEKNNLNLVFGDFPKKQNILCAHSFLLSSCYKSHSFYIGRASYCTSNGHSDPYICSVGRWLSTAFRKYIRL